MCDIAYVLWWERTEREHLALWQAAIIASAMGGTVEVTPLHEAWQAFDAMLVEPPKHSQRSRGQQAALRVLGVA